MHGGGHASASPPRHAAPSPRNTDPYGAALAPPARRVRARFNKPPAGALLFDLRNGRVLWGLQPTTPRPIASVTKMMTALIVVEREPPTATAFITRAALRYQGSGVGLLPPGKRVNVTPLLYGLLLPSGNDAARRFYRAMSFYETVLVPGYYRGGEGRKEGALRMLRVLRAPGPVPYTWRPPKTEDT